MKTKQIALGTLAGTVTMFLFGFLIYGIAISGFMQAHGNPLIARPMDQMLFAVMVLSNFMWALLFAIIISWTNNYGIGSGAKVGATTGFLGLLGLNLTFFATTTVHNNDMTLVIVDSLAFALLSGISGAVTGWVMQKIRTSNTAAA
jgi:hypothetical protein